MAVRSVYFVFLFSRILHVALSMPNIAALERSSQFYTLSLRGGMAKSKASNLQGKEKVVATPSVKSVEM